MMSLQTKKKKKLCVIMQSAHHRVHSALQFPEHLLSGLSSSPFTLPHIPIYLLSFRNPLESLGTQGHPWCPPCSFELLSFSCFCCPFRVTRGRRGSHALRLPQEVPDFFPLCKQSIFCSHEPREWPLRLTSTM